MMSNLGLKVLVWDEYVESAKEMLLQAVEIARRSNVELNQHLDAFLERQEDGKIARFERQVFGIREVKGAEYDDILILNFFSAKIEASDGSGELWRSLSKSCERSWKVLLQTDDASCVPPGVADLQVELQLKMLYTACSRCRCRLVFIETEETAAGLNFFRKLRALEFISSDSKPSDIVFDGQKGKTKVQDDWACEAVYTATLFGMWFCDSRRFVVAGLGRSINSRYALPRQDACQGTGGSGQVQPPQSLLFRLY
jgi:hypothetical protein